MTKINILVAAVVISFVTIASAEVTKTMCLPIKNFQGKVTIEALCDASELNKTYNLVVDANGCATPGQAIESEKAFVLHQAPLTIVAESEVELQKKALATCTVDEAGIILEVELQPWQQ
jgi:hypothetical protein